MVTRSAGNNPMIAFDWIDLFLKHATQFFIIFLVVDRREIGQKRHLTAAMWLAHPRERCVYVLVLLHDESGCGPEAARSGDARQN